MSETSNTVDIDLTASPGRPSILAAPQRANELSRISQEEQLQNKAYNSILLGTENSSIEKVIDFAVIYSFLQTSTSQSLRWRHSLHMS